jgi:integrase/recombinase XerD
MKLESAVEGFIITKTADGLSPNTAVLYEWALGLLSDYLSNPDIKKVTVTEVRKFFAYLRTDFRTRRGELLKPSSLQDIWTAVKSLGKWLQDEMKLTNPVEALPRPRGETVQPQPFTVEELRALLKATQVTKLAKTDRRQGFTMRRSTALRDTAILLVLLDTGLRAGELSRLKVEDVNLDIGSIIVRPFGSGRKTKTRMAYLGKNSRKALWHYLAERKPEQKEPLFLTKTHKPISPNQLLLFMRQLGTRAEVAHVHPHKFRHTFAIQFLRNGGDAFSLQRLLGHSGLDMTRRYVLLADTDTETAHRLASPVDRML